MAHLIDKDALVAEIERISDNAEEVHNSGYVLLCSHLKSFINTFEVKEVDLEKEFENYMDKYNGVWVDSDYIRFAEHFFELGLVSQMTWKDIKLIAEIGMDFMISKESEGLGEEDYYKEILNRFKIQKENRV